MRPAVLRGNDAPAAATRPTIRIAPVLQKIVVSRQRPADVAAAPAPALLPRRIDARRNRQIPTRGEPGRVAAATPVRAAPLLAGVHRRRTEVAGASDVRSPTRVSARARMTVLGRTLTLLSRRAAAPPSQTRGWGSAPAGSTTLPAFGRRNTSRHISLVRQVSAAAPSVHRAARAERATPAILFAAAPHTGGDRGVARSDAGPSGRAVRGRQGAARKIEPIDLAGLERSVATRLEKRIDTQVATAVERTLGRDTEYARRMTERIHGALYDRMVLERERLR
jgi:hypothetical protein